MKTSTAEATTTLGDHTGTDFLSVHSPFVILNSHNICNLWCVASFMAGEALTLLESHLQMYSIQQSCLSTIWSENAYWQVVMFCISYQHYICTFKPRKACYTDALDSFKNHTDHTCSLPVRYHPLCLFRCGFVFALQDEKYLTHLHLILHSGKYLNAATSCLFPVFKQETDKCFFSIYLDLIEKYLVWNGRTKWTEVQETNQ